MQPDTRIYVAGHRGLVGGAIVRALEAAGCRNIITATSAELDLRDPAATLAFLREQRPEQMYVAAAKVGGIHANDSRPAEFLYDNLMIETSLIHGAWQVGVPRLLFLGSTCIYPRLAPQPLKEEYLLTGPLEPTNEWYAVAKIAGIKLAQAYRKQYGCRFISAMPTNLYGPGDNFDLANSHVLPALIRKFHEAKAAGRAEVVVWGTGTPRREFCHVDDCASACLHLMQGYDEAEIVNIGQGADIAIAELAELVRQVVGFEGAITFDTSKPDGTPRKLVDATRLFALGWRPRIALEEGIEQTYRWFLEALTAGQIRLSA
ncbi:MAG TPA: GDP-fucose synthetase [Gammaproteobacteria bacterium]|nr:GDP-fucose synthetase [Gammaproteobacteria bacterium]